MLMPSPLELAANGVTTISIVLAARNHVLTWPLGIVGAVLFAVLFSSTQLYADALLQVFFMATSVIGWRTWQRGDSARLPPVTRTAPGSLGIMLCAALTVTVTYGQLLHHFTDAYMPFIDSAVLGFSVMAQLLLMQRRLETWGFWLIVNSLSVPLFASRGLHLTAALYAFYWVNALWGGWHWWQQYRAPSVNTTAERA
ncbi:MAG: hypothetical protein RLZZ618_3297 [Pseudomonadota bacterium]|jgi:nicotinamide mononucleotide transporter